MTVDTSPIPFKVPTIDVAPYLLDPSSREAEGVIREVREACMASGFFQMVGHGIPISLQESVFRGAASFFALPYEEKKRLDKSKAIGASNRGYEVLGGQSLEEGTLPDLKEVRYKL
jgi:isopenicillin N synthase-like dioxygenase